MEQERNISLARSHSAGEVRCSFTHSHFNLQEKSLAKEMIPWQWGVSVWRTSDAGAVKLFLLASPVCSNVYFSGAPTTMCWKFSSGNLDFHKIAISMSDCLRQCSSGREAHSFPHNLYHASCGYVQLSFSHIYVKSSVTKKLQAPSSN